MSGPKRIPPPPQALKQKGAPPPIPARARKPKDELSGFFTAPKKVPPPLPEKFNQNNAIIPPPLPNAKKPDPEPITQKVPFPREPEPIESSPPKIQAGAIQPRPPTPSGVAALRRKGRKKVASVSKKPKADVPSSIDITHAFEPQQAKISINREFVHLNAKNLFQGVADLCTTLQPSFETEEISFQMDGIFAGNKKIGDFDAEPLRIKIEVPLDLLGFSRNSLPLTALTSEFAISPKDLGKLISNAKTIGIVAMRFGKREVIKLAFFNEEDRMESSISLRQ